MLPVAARLLALENRHAERSEVEGSAVSPSTRFRAAISRRTMMKAMASLLAIQNLTIRFRNQPVVHDLTLSIAAGEVLGLVGESGSGKSVTSLAILGLLDAAAHTSG